MSCMVLTTPEIKMATKQFLRSACYENCSPSEQFHIQHKPLRMNWIVATDENGNRRLQIDWHADRE